MEQLSSFLLSARGDVFKLLPMRESEENGVENHLTQYLENLIINFSGATITYPILKEQKQYLYVLNCLQYMKNHSIEFATWRKIVLNSTKSINDLYTYFCGGGR